MGKAFALSIFIARVINLRLESDQLQSRKIVILVTHLVPYPPRRGVELRIIKLLKWLSRTGYSVVLALPSETIDDEILRELRSVTYAVHWVKPHWKTGLGKKFPFLKRAFWDRLKPYVSRKKVDDRTDNTGITALNPALGNKEQKRALCPDRLISLVANLGRRYRPQVAIAEYIFLTPCFDVLSPEALKIVDTIDMFSLKPEQVLSHGIEDPYACTVEEERQLLLKSDVVVAIQARERDLLEKLVPEREVLLAGMDFETVEPKPLNEARPNSIALVASDNSMNVHGFNSFLEECWPLIKMALPEVSLHVVGSIGERCLPEESAIRFTLWLDDLASVYGDARVVINPTIAGTGLKIKSAQALAYGRPLVAWPSGVEGLEYTRDAPFVVVDSWEEFAHAVVRLLRCDKEAQLLADRAFKYSSESFKPDVVYAELGARLQKHFDKNHAKRSSKSLIPRETTATLH